MLLVGTTGCPVVFTALLCPCSRRSHLSAAKHCPLGTKAITGERLAHPDGHVGQRGRRDLNSVILSPSSLASHVRATERIYVNKSSKTAPYSLVQLNLVNSFCRLALHKAFQNSVESLWHQVCIIFSNCNFIISQGCYYRTSQLFFPFFLHI